MAKLYVVGIGPGKQEQMTYEAGKILEQVDLIVGYQVYVELVQDMFPNKNFYATPMMGERERVQYAIDQVKAGKTVAIVCSGDGGVYGMAGLTHELAEGEVIEIQVVAGVTAALSGAAILGAPLVHDFAVISLSDLMTPWELIAKRLLMAAKGDFSVVLYNPSSKKRKDYLEKACGILLEEKKAETLCGIVRNIGRKGETIRLLTLKELQHTQVDMFTTVFVGNSQTREIDGKMVTPRGYQNG